MRNWYNHIPESLLISECELINQGKLLTPPIDPIEICIFNTVEYEYVKEFYSSNMNFYNTARKLVQVCKRDYSLLIGKHVSLKKIYIDRPVNITKNEAANMSAGIQGLKQNNHKV